MTNINWTKLYEALNWIVTNSERWSQNNWAAFPSIADARKGNFCKTQFCMAGTVCFLADRVTYVPDKYEGYIILPKLDNEELKVYGDEFRDIAQKILGLTDEQTTVIFASTPPMGISSDVWETPELYRAFVLAYLRGDVRLLGWRLTASSEGTWARLYERVSQDLDRSGDSPPDN